MPNEPCQPCPIIHVRCTAEQSDAGKCTVQVGKKTYRTRTSAASNDKAKKIAAAQQKRRCSPLVRVHGKRVKAAKGPYAPLTTLPGAKVEVATPKARAPRVAVDPYWLYQARVPGVYAQRPKKKGKKRKAEAYVNPYLIYGARVPGAWPGMPRMAYPADPRMLYQARVPGAWPGMPQKAKKQKASKMKVQSEVYGMYRRKKRKTRR